MPLRSLKRSSGAGALLLPGEATLPLASAVSDEDLKTLHSVLTILGGTVVHSGAIKYWA